MTKQELMAAVNACKAETRDALQTMYDALNHGQQKQIVKRETVRMLFDRYHVDYTDSEG